MTNYIRPSVRYFDNVVCRTLDSLLVSSSDVEWINAGWSVVIMCFNCSNHAPEVDLESIFGSFFMTFFTTEFLGHAPSISWTFGSGLRILVEIIMRSSEFLSL